MRVVSCRPVGNEVRNSLAWHPFITAFHRALASSDFNPCSILSQSVSKFVGPYSVTRQGKQPGQFRKEALMVSSKRVFVSCRNDAVIAEFFLVPGPFPRVH